MNSMRIENLNHSPDFGCDVTSTGRREGAEVAEVYVGESHPPVPRPQKELKGFARVNLEPGATQHVKVFLDSRAFAYFDVSAHVWRVDRGNLRFSWAALSTRPSSKEQSRCRHQLRHRLRPIRSGPKLSAVPLLADSPSQVAS